MILRELLWTSSTTRKNPSSSTTISYSYLSKSLLSLTLKWSWIRLKKCLVLCRIQKSCVSPFLPSCTTLEISKRPKLKLPFTAIWLAFTEIWERGVWCWRSWWSPKNTTFRIFSERDPTFLNPVLMTTLIKEQKWKPFLIYKITKLNLPSMDKFASKLMLIKTFSIRGKWEWLWWVTDPVWLQ